MSGDIGAQRIRLLVESLRFSPGEALLEIGCGHGLAISLVAARLETGRLTAIDRSRKMVEAARKRNAEAIASGKVDIVEADLKNDPGRSFDLVFAMNVNAFWLDPARSVHAAAQRLKPSGRLVLMYHFPPQMAPRDIAGSIAAAMKAAGLVDVVTSASSDQNGSIRSVAAHI